MYFRMLSGSAAIDQDRFSLHFAESHNTRFITSEAVLCIFIYFFSHGSS